MKWFGSFIFERSVLRSVKRFPFLEIFFVAEVTSVFMRFLAREILFLVFLFLGGMQALEILVRPREKVVATKEAI